MGGGLSTRSGDADKRHHQELIDKYWSLKESIEDRTVKFLRCVDILESASVHILSCHEKTKDQDITLACDPITRKLISTSKVLEEGERKQFIDGIVKFVEFVSQKVTDLQTDNGHRDVECFSIREYLRKSTDEIVDKKDAVNLNKIFEDFQQQIKNLDEQKSTLRKEKEVLLHLKDSLEKSNEEYIKFNSEREKVIKNKNQEIDELKKSVEAFGKDKQLKQDEISQLNIRLKDHEKHIEKVRLEHEKENEKKKEEINQYETKISQLSGEAAHLKNDIAVLLKNHWEERDKMFDEKSVAELEWKELIDNVNTIFHKKCELENALRKSMIELDTANNDIISLQAMDTSYKTLIQYKDVLEQKLNQTRLDFNKCDDEKREFKTALDETRKGLHKTETKLKNAEQNLHQVFDKLEKCAKENEVLTINLNQHIEMYQKCVKDKNEIDSELRQFVERYELCFKEKEITDEQLRSLQTKHRTLEMDHRSKSTKLETSEKQGRNLEQELQSCRSQIKKLSDELKEKEKIEEKLRSLQSKHRTLEMDHKSELMKFETCKKQRRNLEQDLQNCRSDNKALSDKLTDMKMKRITKVKLFSVRRPNTVSDFEDAVIAMLKSKIDDDVRELKFEQRNNPDDVNTDTDPTIVLCFCGSRIGTDAEKAVEGLNLSPKMALVMIHHKDVHALPQQLSERVIIGQEFKKLDCITDMAFLRDKGIFPCEINNNSLVKLVNFIKQKGIEYNKY